MRVWIICASEPLPVDQGRPRLMRAGILAQTLAECGHRVTWWSSSFNHTSKQHRKFPGSRLDLGNGLTINLLSGVAYRKNVSLSRIQNHYQIGRMFLMQAPAEEAPDVIFCCWPVIELAVAAVQYANRRGIPIVLDVRDLWPHIFPGTLPPFLRPIARVAVLPYRWMARFAFRNCSAVTGTSDEYLRWGVANADRTARADDMVFPLGYAPLPPRGTEDAHAMDKLLKMGVDPARLVLWFLGSFGATYDLATVIRVARMFREAGDLRLQFVFSGDGEKGAAWRKLASGLDNVTFTGWLDSEEILCMMRLAAVGIAAYRKGAPQGLPNKIIEYLAAGLPIVGSLPGECQKFLEMNRCGLTYRAGDADNLREVFRRLAENPDERLHMGRNAIDVFQGRYAAPTTYGQLAKHLEHIARTRP